MLAGRIYQKNGTWLKYDLVLGYTREAEANQFIEVDYSTDLDGASASNLKVPSQLAVKTYVDTIATGLLDYRGTYDASGNTYPTTGGSGTAGAIMKSDMWVISVAGTLGGNPIHVGDFIIAKTDSPGQTSSNWNTMNANISYVPEDVANKVTSISGSSTDIQYPTAKLLYDQLALKANVGQTFYLGTTQIAINRTSGAIVLTGITSIDGNAATASLASKSTNLVGGNSTTLLGSIPYQSNVDVTTLLSPNTTTTKNFLSMTGTGANGAVPSWSTVSKTDIGLGNVDNVQQVPLSVLTDILEPTGFLDPDNINVSYSYTNRTITLTGNLSYYWRGVKYTLTSPWTSSAHTNSTGIWFLSSTDGTNFTWSNTPWVFSVIQVSVVSRGSSAATSFALRETHGVMDYRSHEELHSLLGTYRVSGGILTAGTYTENTATNAATTPGFDQAVIKDEDISTTIPAWSEGTYTTAYVGASNVLTFSIAASFPFLSAGSYIQYNNATAGTLVTGATGKYYNVYQILLPCASDSDSQKYRVIVLQPQVEYSSLSTAQGEDIRSLNLGNLTSLSPEYVIYARITYVTSAADGNTGKVRIATGGVSYLTGSKANQVSVSGFSATNHAALSNLSWTSSGHIGTASKTPSFDASGLPIELGVTGSFTYVKSWDSTGTITVQNGIITAIT